MATTIKEAFANANVEREDFDEVAITPEVKKNILETAPFKPIYPDFSKPALIGIILKVADFENLTRLARIKQTNLTDIVMNETEKFINNYDFKMIDRIRVLYQVVPKQHAFKTKNLSISKNKYGILVNKIDAIIEDYCNDRKCSKYGLKTRIFRFIVEKLLIEYSKKHPDFAKITTRITIDEEEEKITETVPEKGETNIQEKLEILQDLTKFAVEVNNLLKECKNKELIKDKSDAFLRSVYSVIENVVKES